MSAAIQTITALAIVALTAIWLVLRALSHRKNPGCGGDCVCPASKITVKPASRRPQV